MATKETTIYQGQDSNGDSAAFVTPEAAVFDEKGVCLKDKLANLDLATLEKVYNEALKSIQDTGDQKLADINKLQTVAYLDYTEKSAGFNESLYDDSLTFNTIISMYRNGTINITNKYDTLKKGMTIEVVIPSPHIDPNTNNGCYVINNIPLSPQEGKVFYAKLMWFGTDFIQLI